MNDASATRTAQVRHKCFHFDLDNDTSGNIFSHLSIYYVASQRLRGEERFHSKNYLLEMPRSHAKIRLKSEPKKLKKVISKKLWQKLYEKVIH